MLLAPATAAPSSSSPSPSFPVSVAADGSEAMAKDDDDSSANVFATLMPNLFKKLQQSDDTITEKGFHDIDRLLKEVTTEEQEAYGNSIMKKPLKTFLDLKANEDTNEHDLGIKETDHTMQKSSLLERFEASGKENMLQDKICHRNRHSRRERSTRVTSHRRAFVVDLKSLGSVSDDGGLEGFKMPQDVHAFWEAADEREAAEAIMTKLKGGSQTSSQTLSRNSRRLGVRRQNSRRLATRLKGFSVDLLSCAEQMQSLDKEQLEEEDYATEESSFTFLSNTDFRVDKGICESQTSVDNSVISELSPVHSYKVPLDIPETDEVMDLENETMSDGKSPFSGFKAHDECNSSQTRTSDSVVGWDKFITSSQIQEVVEVGLSQPVSSLMNEADCMREERDVTPCYRNPMSKRTPITSPTPPSNPLAGLVFRRDSNTMESIGKRRLEADFAETMDSSAQQFEMSYMDSPVQGIDLPAVDSSILEEDMPTINATEDIELPAQTARSTPLLQDVPDMFPENNSQERNFHHMEEMDIIATESTDCVSNLDENKKKRPKTDRPKRKRGLADRRESLDGAGTNWNEGVRRSTRVRSRPLEWWRGERFLRGRVHKSLATVIGIKYSSPPPPCWKKRDAKVPNFKVESYVSEEYSKYVNFAALY